MSKPFALWVAEASTPPIADTDVLVSGPVLGRAPDPGDALSYWAPLAGPERFHCAGVLGLARGKADAPFTLGLRGTAPANARNLVGGLVVEAGVPIRAFSATLKVKATPGVRTARYIFDDDYGWGLLAIHGHVLNAVVVGGDLPVNPWRVLREVRSEKGERFLHDQLEPVEYEGASALWKLPTLKTYARTGDERAFVVRPLGLVKRDRVSIIVDGDIRNASVAQQANGLAQFFVPGGPGMDETHLVMPAPAA